MKTKKGISNAICLTLMLDLPFTNDYYAQSNVCFSVWFKWTSRLFHSFQVEPIGRWGDPLRKNS